MVFYYKFKFLFFLLISFIIQGIFTEDDKIETTIFTKINNNNLLPKNRTEGEKRLAFMLSGSGEIMQSILYAIQENKINAEVNCVISTSEHVVGVYRAVYANITHYTFTKEKYPFGNERDVKIIEKLRNYDIDYIILDGYLGIISDLILNEYPNRIINIQPSLLPKFGGKHLHGLKLQQAILDAGEKETGATIHFVTNKLGEGQIIEQRKFKIHKNETAEMLYDRVLETIEQPMIVDVIKRLCE